MSITTPVQLEIISQDNFHNIDHIIMGHAFNIQNEFGCFCSEKAYQNELATRCSNDESGLIYSVKTEFPIQLSHQAFTKIYWTDLVINQSIIYELKVVEKLCEQHRAQLLNYLMLNNVHYGKLINFGSPSVQSEFISTNLTEELRKTYTVSTKNWSNEHSESTLFKNNMIQIIDTYGLFLDVSLYSEIVTSFYEQSGNVIKPINIVSNGAIVAQQKAHLLNSKIAFKISMISRNLQSYENHLKKFLNHTELKSILWVNLNHNTITFTKIEHQ